MALAQAARIRGWLMTGALALTACGSSEPDEPAVDEIVPRDRKQQQGHQPDGKRRGLGNGDRAPPGPRGEGKPQGRISRYRRGMAQRLEEPHGGQRNTDENERATRETAERTWAALETARAAARSLVTAAPTTEELLRAQSEQRRQVQTAQI